MDKALGGASSGQEESARKDGIAVQSAATASTASEPMSLREQMKLELEVEKLRTEVALAKRPWHTPAIVLAILGMGGSALGYVLGDDKRSVELSRVQVNLERTQLDLTKSKDALDVAQQQVAEAEAECDAAQRARDQTMLDLSDAMVALSSVKDQIERLQKDLDLKRATTQAELDEARLKLQRVRDDLAAAEQAAEDAAEAARRAEEARRKPKPKAPPPAPAPRENPMARDGNR
jgi:septal ring factor EnvC (AmiA/AmiB activator)